MSKGTDALLFPAIVSAMSGGAYDFVMTEIARGCGRKRQGTVVGCHVCGKTGMTLYKDGDKRICRNCRESQRKKNNDG